MTKNLIILKWNSACYRVVLYHICILNLLGCTPVITPKDTPITITPQPIKDTTLVLNESTNGVSHADILSVKTTGSPKAYFFSVEVQSPDTDCAFYADWWEILAENGDLLYRRILAHSHPNEQPFTRSGGPVNIDEEKVVIIRAHMHPLGYGDTAMIGSVEQGFRLINIGRDFAADVESESPLPSGCAF